MSGEKAALYVRLSEEDRDKEKDFQESRSIINQKSLLFTYAEENGFQIAGVYSDEDYTGSDRNRPMFKKLIRDASMGKFSVVLCKSQSRFTREMELVEKYIHGLFPLWGIRFIGVVDRADTLVPGNKKARQINGLVNEWYLEDLSESIKSVLNDLRSKGRHIGAFAPYGYKKDENNKGHLIPDEPAARVVRKIFSLYIEGMSKMNISRYLNDNRIPTPAQYKSQNSLNWKNSKETGKLHWHYYTVASILENPMYAGTMVQGKKKSLSYKSSKTVKTEPKDWFVVENTHEPLIDRAVWEQAEKMRKSNAKPAYKIQNIDVFSGKVYCGFCGKKLRKAYHCRNGNKKIYYRCPTRLIGKEYCCGTSIVSEKLKNIAVGEFLEICRSVLSDSQLKSLCFFGFENSFELEGKKQTESRLDNVLSELSKIKDVFVRSYLDKCLGKLTEDEYNAVLYKLKSEKDKLENEKKDLTERLENLKAVLEGRKISEQEDSSFLKGLLQDEKLKDEICRELIEKVIIYGHEKNSRTAVVEVYWDI